MATQKSTRRRRKKVFRTTALQRYSLDFIRVTLAEKGFHIFPVAPWFRRHSRDFLAIPRQDYHMILVRPNRKGGIELRTYTAKFHYTRLRNELSKYKNELAKMRWGVWLQSGDNQNGWKKYISKRYASAVKLFVEEDVDR